MLAGGSEALRGGGDATEDAHMHAADAVANISVANPKAQKAFYAAGAVPLLLEQLHSGKSQTSIANALAKLLSPSTAIGAPANVDIQEEIANDGGIAPLLALLSGMTTAAQVRGFDWTGLVSTRRTRLDSSGLDWTRLDSTGLDWTRLSSARLGSARLSSARLGSARLGLEMT